MRIEIELELIHAIHFHKAVLAALISLKNKDKECLRKIKAHKKLIKKYETELKELK